MQNNRQPSHANNSRQWSRPVELAGRANSSDVKPSLKATKSPTLEQFCLLPLVLPPRSCGTRALLEDALKRFGIRPQVLMEVDDVGTIVSIVKSGVAATILPRILPSVSRSLVLSEISNFTGEVKGVLLYPRSPTPEARSFMDIVSERIKLQTEWTTV